jgi:hypothetical protein
MCCRGNIRVANVYYHEGYGADTEVFAIIRRREFRGVAQKLQPRDKEVNVEVRTRICYQEEDQQRRTCNNNREATTTTREKKRSMRTTPKKILGSTRS